jgi:DNA-binding IclR family transcriptional regulator
MAQSPTLPTALRIDLAPDEIRVIQILVEDSIGMTMGELAGRSGLSRGEVEICLAGLKAKGCVRAATQTELSTYDQRCAGVTGNLANRNSLDLERQRDDAAY